MGFDIFRCKTMLLGVVSSPTRLNTLSQKNLENSKLRQNYTTGARIEVSALAA